MSKTTVDVKTERCPIAPDGYIPNSVIRNWWKKEKLLPQTDSWEDYFPRLLLEDEDTVNDQEDLTRYEVVEDKERTWYVTGWETESEDEEAEVQVKERRVLPKESYFGQTKIALQNLQRTSDHDGQINMEPRRREVSDDTRGTLIYISTGCQQNEEERKLHEHVTPPLQHLSEQRTSSLITNKLDMMTSANLVPPEECPVPSVDEVLSKEESRIDSYKPPVEAQNMTPRPLKLSSSTPKNPQPQPDLGPHHLKPPPPASEDPQPPTDLGPHHPKPPASEDPQPPTDLGPHHPKPPPRNPEDPQPPTDLGPHHPKPPASEDPQPPTDLGPHHPKPPPRNPEDPQPQPYLGPSEFSRISDKRFLLASAQHNIIGNQTHAPLDDKVLQLYKEYKAGTKTSLNFGKLSTITEHLLASTSSIVQGNFGALKSDRQKNLYNHLQELKLHKQITPPLQHLSEQRTSTFITNNVTSVSSEPPEESPLLSPEEVLSKQEPRIASYILPKGTPRPLKLSPTPVNPQPQPDLGPCHLKACPTNPEDPQPDLGPCHLKACPTNPEDPQLDLGQPDRRKNLRVPLPGLCFPPSTRGLPVKPPDGRQRVTIVPLILPAEAAAYQRVVQNIRMTDAPDPRLLRFHHVIPLNAQQNIFTLNASGKTPYGRLQFDWARG
uniref:proteoglycan 4-like n=1 Tax=Gasterosteus aculeatus aculeatus TaxID=481459 RepID=UPI001A99552A|nr:proteoglycan 4-like [Gasterosteus aculeatus aculeatus]